MNSQKPAVVYAWGQDLEASRDVNERQRDAFGMVLGWLENWRMRSGTEPGRASCIRFWRELLGHADVKATEIHPHVAKGVGALGIRSPLDAMGVG